jgi:hypothetical protein
VYHDKPDSGHALHHLFNNGLADTVPTVLIGDFNSHSPRWSLPHSTPSPWANAFHDWMDDNGLEILNPVHTFTWSQKGSRSSIIDLALANEQARYFTSLSTATVSWKERVSDHAALLLNFLPEEATTEPHAPRIGFITDANKKEEWSSSFRLYLQTHRIHDTTSPEIAIKILHEAILQTCRQHLAPIKRLPPRGASWWTQECSTALQQIEGTVGTDRTTASKAFRKTVREAKRVWAHDQLFETTDPETIWRLARVRKGRRSPLLPPLKDSENTLQSDTASKTDILRNRFFPIKSNHVDLASASIKDPEPLPRRTWPPISNDEVALCLKGTSNKSAPGISGINYKLIKWAFDADPSSFSHVFNLSLSTGIHVWKQAAVVPVAKPQKPDYSIAKAYRPVSLLECTGKLLEKIVTKRISNEIAVIPDILPNNQFGSRPQHSTVDAAITLVHRIQSARQAGYHATLILFDISGFFDHIDADRAKDICDKKGFPSNVVNWIHSFLTNRSAVMKIDSVTSEPFPIPDGTPQGSPLSPILSALFTSFLLQASKSWEHAALSMYVDDGAILAVSATPRSATEHAIARLEESITWLAQNGLSTDADKTEIMVFSPPRYRGPTVKDTAYTDPSGARHRVLPTTKLRYLGIYLTPKLDWQPHVSIMANRARSTIRGLSILGNSIRGLDLVHWKQVYLTYAVPILTYGAPVWFTGLRQKGLINTLQVAQNEGIRKILGVFRTTPTEVSENMIGIAPMKYLLPRITESYSNRLAATNPHHLFHSIQRFDQCTYAAPHFVPHTTLTVIQHSLHDNTFVPPLPFTWSHPNVTLFSPPTISPPPKQPSLYYIPSTHDSNPIIHITSKSTNNVFTLLHTVHGLDHIHALGIAVTLSLEHYDTFSSHYVHLRSFEEKLTSPKPHTHSFTYHKLRSSFSSSSTLHHIYLYNTLARDSPTKTQRRHWTDRFAASSPTAPPSYPPSPRTSMWQKIQAEYVPITHPSALACQTPNNGKPVDAIEGSLTAHSRIVTSAISQLATGHCFDADYSARFRPSADDNTTCPCSTPFRTHLHTRHHVLFKCAIYAHIRRRLMPRPWRLPVILQSRDASAKFSLFLQKSDCSILRPLPNNPPRSPPVSPVTPLNPDPP